MVSNPEDVANVIAKADIMATAIGVNVLKFVAKPIAMGISKRMKEGNTKPLNIIICENKLGADVYLTGLIKEHLTKEECEYFDNNIGMVEASIGRMVPATPKEISEQNILAVCVEEFCQLPVDKDAFKGEIPEIVNLQPFSPFEFFIQRKLFMHNMSHALTAYLGWLYGYEYIWQAEKNTEIKLLGLQALLESSMALSKAHGVKIEELIDHSEDLLNRFENKLLGDTVARVGKDTIRKLSEQDRIIGAINSCKKQNICPVYICLALAAGLLFSPQDDAQSVEVAAYAKTEGVAATLGKYSNFTDKAIVTLVDEMYNMLARHDDISKVRAFVQKAERNWRA